MWILNEDAIMKGLFKCDNFIPRVDLMSASPAESIFRQMRGSSCKLSCLESQQAKYILQNHYFFDSELCLFYKGKSAISLVK